jgi:spermidine/putrescine transport system permease protein
MAAVATRVETPELQAPPAAPPSRRWTRFILPAYVALVMFYLVAPILVMILFSFNDSGFKKVSFRWLGFTGKWFAPSNLFVKQDLTEALKNSLVVAAATAVIATTLGTLVALALVRYRFRGRTTADFMLFLNIAALFITFGVPRGLPTIIVAHVMFTVAYVAVTVRARLAGFDRSLEEAAQDLGAGPWQTFRLVTLPLIFPGVIAGGLLAFALSIDDFVITNFNSGATKTFPLWVYGAVKVGIPPQVFVMGTLIFGLGVVLAVANVVLQRRKAHLAR